MSILESIAYYFSNIYTGDDKKTPRMTIEVDEMREVTGMHQELCRMRKYKDMAVWTSVEEGLPNKDGEYEVLVADLDCEQDEFVATSHFSNKVNINTGNIFGFGFRPGHYNIDFTKHKVVAWRNKTY